VAHVGEEHRMPQRPQVQVAPTMLSKHGPTRAGRGGGGERIGGSVSTGDAPGNG
jgi:hypothetical protein